MSHYKKFGYFCTFFVLVNLQIDSHAFDHDQKMNIQYKENCKFILIDRNIFKMRFHATQQKYDNKTKCEFLHGTYRNKWHENIFYIIF